MPTTTELPLHTIVDGFEVIDNSLAVDGQRIIDIVSESGDTPLYLYFSALIRARVARLRSVLPPSVKLHYAMKANPNTQVVGLVAGLVDGIDVASAGELSIALTTNTARGEISFAGPGKRQPEIDAAVEAGIVLNVESETEIARSIDAARRLGRKANVAVRVNPAFELKGSGMRMGGGPKAFGIDAERVPDILASLDGTNLEFKGFHIFAGSQNLNADSICETQSRCVELAIELSLKAPQPPEFVNIGGGFGIPYFPGDKPLDIEPIGRHLNALSRELDCAIPGSRLVIELGRYLVGEAGIYVCRVVDRKISRGQTFLITDGGLHHHLALSGNFGQVIRRNYPVVIANRVETTEKHPTNIVGPLCTPMDVLADKMMLPHAEIGDLIAVFQSGAYGFSASPRSFLSHPEPREILV